MKNKKFYWLILCMIVHPLLWAGSYLEDGEKLFLENKPVEAKPLLEEALKIDPMNEKIYHYLSIVYEQIGDPAASFALLKKGINYATNLKYIFYNNMGNNLFVQEQNTLAEEMYTKAIAENMNFPDPYLNRANSRINLENYSGAVTDYKKFLQLYPDTPKRPKIEEIIRLLMAMAEEQDRLKQEQQAKEQNLKNLLDSLQNATDNTKNISEGTDKLKQNYEEEGILE